MALGFRSGNPALTKKTFEGLESDSSNATMTLDGTVNKTSLSLLILLFCAYYLFFPKYLFHILGVYWWIYNCFSYNFQRYRLMFHYMQFFKVWHWVEYLQFIIICILV